MADSSAARPHPVPGAHTEEREAEEKLAALRQRLARSVARICPPWLAASADDITQAAIVRLVKMVGTGGNRVLAASYLEKMAYTAMVDEMRRHFRRREVAEERAPEVASVSAEAADPEREAFAREIDRGITACMEALVRTRRVAVTLFLQGDSVPDVGEALGWTTKKAEHLVYRALEQLRQCLSRKGLRP
jgi:RNA polymerase sigma-70 factor, ECF subfamily